MLKGQTSREVCGHAPLDSFEIGRLWNAILPVCILLEIQFCIGSKHQEYLSYDTRVTKNLQHTLTPCPLCSNSLTVLRQRQSKGSVPFQKTWCVFSLNYSLQLTQSSISQIEGSSEIKVPVASFLASNQHLMNVSSMFLVHKVAFVITGTSPTSCVSSSESRMICYPSFSLERVERVSFIMLTFLLFLSW